jgi:microcystin-dependent protein
MSAEYLGLIKLMVKSDYNNWMLCHGQGIAVRQNAALYSLLGNRFGGQDYVYFKLPDLRGKSPVAGHEYYICINGLYPRRDDEVYEWMNI